MTSTKRWLIVVGVALALRVLVAFAFLGSMPQVGDAASYVEFAGSLLSNFPGPAYYWPPGNSLFLAAVFSVTGESPFAMRVLMTIFSIAGVVFTALLAQQVRARKEQAAKAELTTGLIAALYMPAVLLVAQSYAQHLAALTLVAVAYFSLRATREGAVWLYAAAGAAFGVGVLTRPSMVSVAPVLLFLWGRSLKVSAPRGMPALAKVVLGGALFLLPATATIAPVVIHNRAEGAGATISTNNERNFFLGNNRYTPNYKTSHLGQRELKDLAPDARAYLESFYVRPDARDAMKKEALSFMVSHPLVTAYRTWNRFTSFWGFDYIASRIIQEDRGFGTKGLLPLLLLEGGSYVLVMSLALLALISMREESDGFARRALVAFALAYELPYMLAFSGGTYHFPVVGLLMPFAAIAIDRVREGGVREVLKLAARSRAWLAIAAFAALEAQYAYYAILMKG
jgi:hypothetical protein